MAIPEQQFFGVLGRILPHVPCTEYQHTKQWPLTKRGRVCGADYGGATAPGSGAEARAGTAGEERSVGEGRASGMRSMPFDAMVPRQSGIMHIVQNTVLGIL